MEGKELNKLRLKAEIMLDKANQLIRFHDMIESRKASLRNHLAYLDTKKIVRINHEINVKQVLINSLKNDLQCIS